MISDILNSHLSVIQILLLVMDSSKSLGGFTSIYLANFLGFFFVIDGGYEIIQIVVIYYVRD